MQLIFFGLKTKRKKSSLIIQFRLGCFCSTSTVSNVPLSFPLSPIEASFSSSLVFFWERGYVVQLGSREECVSDLIVLTQNVLWFCLPDMRGFMTAHGQPDQPRSARYVLKDYVSVSASYIWVFFPARRWIEGAGGSTVKLILFIWIKLTYI